MKGLFKYTEKDVERVQDMAERGVSDAEIIKKTGFKTTWVGLITTNYWKQKMKRKEYYESKANRPLPKK